MKRTVLSILVENRAGVLRRVAGLFSRRGYNIESMTAAETEDQGVTRITAVVSGEDVYKRQPPDTPAEKPPRIASPA